MTSQRLILFDFDGVIADSFTVFRECLGATLRAAGAPEPPTPEAFRDLFDRNLFASLAALGVDAGVLPGLLEDLVGRLRLRLPEIGLFPGIPAALRRLASACPMVVVTSNHSAPVAALLGRHGLDTVFQAVLGADVHPAKVPKIRRLQEAYPEAGIVYVGDTTGDMVEAREAGVRCAGAAWGWHGRERLAASAPDYLLDLPGDLVRLLPREGA